MIALALSFVCLCVLAVFDMMKNSLQASGSFPRVLSALASLLCGIAGFLSGRMLLPLSAAVVMLANALLLLAPGYAESWRLMVRSEVETSVFALAAIVFGGRYAPVYMMCVSVLTCFIGSVFRTRRRFRRVTALFFFFSAWRCVEDVSRSLAVLLILLPAFPAFVAPFLEEPLSGILSGISCLVLLGIYVWRYLRQMNGRSLVLAPVKEETLRGLINGNLKTQNTEEEATRMAALYSRVQSFMELRRPFLSDEFSLDDLAKNVFSNKTYLSRTINVMSGRNFCAFVNWYRVRYAQSLIRRNPHMRFSEMAAVCGFHSIPSFNMAFKANTGLTPSQWKQQEWGIDEP